jgi:hypothetical protein
VIDEIAATSVADGIVFDPAAMTIEPIREDADCSGVRVKLPASLAGAELRLTVDLSFGDPIVPMRIDYPTLLDGERFPLLGYPLESVIAEKAITMLTLGDANTRDPLPSTAALTSARSGRCSKRMGKGRRPIRGAGPFLLPVR